MGPNLYVAPGGGFTSLHQDGEVRILTGFELVVIEIVLILLFQNIYRGLWIRVTPVFGGTMKLSCCGGCPRNINTTPLSSLATMEFIVCHMISVRPMRTFGRRNPSFRSGKI